MRNLVSTIRSSRQVYILLFATICLSVNAAEAGQVRCHELHTDGATEAIGSFDLLIDDVPETFARNEYTNMEIENAFVHIGAELMLGKSLDGAATGGLGIESGKLLIVVRESESGHLVQIRAEPWTKAGVTTGQVEQGTPGARLYPVGCVFNR